MKLASATSSCEDIAICCYMVSLPVSVMPASAFGGSSFVGSTTSPHLPHQERSKSPPEKEKEKIKKREKERGGTLYYPLYTLVLQSSTMYFKYRVFILFISYASRIFYIT